MDSQVAYIFNEMKYEYDDLRDLWYSWLYSRLHYFIACDIAEYWRDNFSANVLDIGCGTGFQSFLFAYAGAKVTGLDIAEDLIKVARDKKREFSERILTLFSAHHPYVEKYDARIRNVIEKRFPIRPYYAPEFNVGDITSLSFEDESFAHVNCCGSVLSFVEEHRKAICEMARVLKPDGIFTIDVEARYSMDLPWTIWDSITGGHAGFELDIKEALSLIRTPLSDHVKVEYPFGEKADPIYMDLKLFSKAKLVKELNAEGLSVLRTRTIHSVTNLIPSTWLHSTNPSTRLTKLFYLLAYLESRLPIRFPGSTIMITGRKETSKRL